MMTILPFSVLKMRISPSSFVWSDLYLLPEKVEIPEHRYDTVGFCLFNFKSRRFRENIYLSDNNPSRYIFIYQINQ
ncbi:MAG: hypothetical protein LUC18_04545, partial [Porphyromonadaceae bacterium]|nr:hypothetical protein [Porphyromonadaceae bacterium]